jgi:hypothetical protein
MAPVRAKVLSKVRILRFIKNPISASFGFDPSIIYEKNMIAEAPDMGHLVADDDPNGIFFFLLFQDQTFKEIKAVHVHGCHRRPEEGEFLLFPAGKAFGPLFALF